MKLFDEVYLRTKGNGTFWWSFSLYKTKLKFLMKFIFVQREMKLFDDVSLCIRRNESFWWSLSPYKRKWNFLMKLRKNETFWWSFSLRKRKWNMMMKFLFVKEKNNETSRWGLSLYSLTQHIHKLCLYLRRSIYGFGREKKSHCRASILSYTYCSQLSFLTDK